MMWENTVDWALPFFRESAEELMVDRWEVRRVTDLTTDPLTGKDIPEYTTVYEGKGKLQSFEGYEQTPNVVEHTSTIQRMSIHLPIGDYRPRVGDIARCVESTDPNLVGTEYRMTQDAPFKSLATAYRVFVEFKAE